MSFKDLKNRSGTTAAIELLNKQLGDLKNQGQAKDDRYWYPELDKASNGFGVIRFLPPSENETAAWVRIYSHGFQGPGGWYIENCPTTINGGKCPVCEANGQLWNTKTEASQALARSRKRKLSYVSNILVLSDPKHPENEGKVFLYRYGKQIFDKIQEKLTPPEAFGEKPQDIFDFWTGSDFQLKIMKVEGYVNYNRSEFKSPSALQGGNDAKLEAIWKKQYPLQPLIAPGVFKPYEELATRFDQVLNPAASTTRSAATTNLASNTGSAKGGKRTAALPESDDAPWEDTQPVRAKTTASAKTEEGEDPLSYFERLTEAD